MSTDLNTAIAQLIDPDPTKPVFLTGIRLPAVDNLGLFTCHDIRKFVDEPNGQVNLTPERSFVDLQIKPQQ